MYVLIFGVLESRQDVFNMNNNRRVRLFSSAYCSRRASFYFVSL